MSRLPDPIRAPRTAGGKLVQKTSFNEEPAAKQELNWRRRQIAPTDEPALRTPQTGIRVSRRQDPLSDPFGDRPITPAPAASMAPASSPRLQPTLGNAAFSARRNQEPSAENSSRKDCNVLLGEPISSISFSIAPPLYPELDEKRQETLRLLHQLIGNPVVTWTTKKDGEILSFKGRYVSLTGEAYIETIEIETPEKERLVLGNAMSGFLTPESLMMAELLTQNPLQDWVDRKGQVVARGWFVDYINDSVIIRTESGEDISVRYNDLSPGSVKTVNSIWDLPSECPVPAVGSTQRDWVAQTYTWKASALCHKPLYFEDIQLERYGHSAGPLVQPFRSGAHFFLNIAALPYNVGVYPPTECRYALGYYRPGNCAPFRGYALPLSKRGALTATGFYIAAPVILP